MAGLVFVCVLILVSGFSVTAGWTNEATRPMGQMVSDGRVDYDTGDDSWKTVPRTQFPVFQGTRVKTARGTSVVALDDNRQIEIGPESLLSFEKTNRVLLVRGNIVFRIPSGSDTSFRAGDLSILTSHPLQAASDKTSSPAGSGETIGTVSLHPNGSVTVRSIRGRINILNQSRVVLSSLTSDQSVTLPSVIASGKDQTTVAQANENKPERNSAAAGTGAGLAGLSTSAWVGIGASAATFGAMGYSAQDYTTGAGGAACP